MANVTGNIKINATSSQAAPSTVPGTATALSIQQSMACNFTTPGNGADQVNLKHSKTYTVNNAVTTLDLTALTDDYGGSVAFVKVRSVYIKNKSTTNAEILTVSPGASNGWTSLLGANSTLVLRPSTNTNDGGLVVTAPSNTGWAVAANSKTLSLDPGTANFSVDVEIMGTN